MSLVYWKNGLETLLRDVIVILTIAFLCQFELFVEKVFGSKYKPYFTWEMAEEFAYRLFGGHYLLVFHGLFVQLQACNIPQWS